MGAFLLISVLGLAVIVGLAAYISVIINDHDDPFM